MDEEIVKLPPKRNYDIKTKPLSSSAFSSSTANQPEYINVKAESSPTLVSSFTEETSPSVKPKKIVGLLSKQPESSDIIEKREYINVKTGIPPNVLPLSPKKNLDTTSASFHDHNDLVIPPQSGSLNNVPSLVPKKITATYPKSSSASNEYINVQKTNDDSNPLLLPLSPKPIFSESSYVNASPESYDKEHAHEYMNVKLLK